MYGITNILEINTNYDSHPLLHDTQGMKTHNYFSKFIHHSSAAHQLTYPQLLNRQYC